MQYVVIWYSSEAVLAVTSGEEYDYGEFVPFSSFFQLESKLNKSENLLTG